MDVGGVNYGSFCQQLDGRWSRESHVTIRCHCTLSFRRRFRASLSHLHSWKCLPETICPIDTRVIHYFLDRAWHLKTTTSFAIVPANYCITVYCTCASRTTCTSRVQHDALTVQRKALCIGQNIKSRKRPSVRRLWTRLWRYLLTDLHQIWNIASLYHREEHIFKQFDPK